MDIDNILLHALAAAAHGWAVAPAIGKHPPLDRWQERGTADPEGVRALFNEVPRATGYGVLTGAKPGVDGKPLFVIDVDPRHGGDDTLAALEDSISALPDTVRVLTGGGGLHVYFEHPGGRIPGKADALGSGVDTRSDAQQVIGSGSIHPDTGRRYEFEAGYEPKSVDVAPLPEAWLTFIRATLVPAPTAAPKTAHTAYTGPSLVDRIKAALPIEVMADRITVMAWGSSRGSGLCPFHNDTSPSFVVWPGEGKWKCFGACDDSGDVIDLWRLAKAQGAI